MPRPRSRAAVWRTLRRLILEAGGFQVEALEDLGQFDELAEEMARYNSTGYELVILIAQQSPDPESRDRARRVFTQLQLAESLQGRIVTHIRQGMESVDAGYTVTMQAMTLVAHWREGS